LNSGRERVRMLSEVFSALGHPTRLGIIELLQERELTVSEIADRLDAGVTSVSKHLSLLRGLGMVRGRKVGLTMCCTLSLFPLSPFIRCVEKRVNRRAGDEERAVETGKERRDGAGTN
jgi:DNA-binding transcriptional ArsR family regulator